MWEPLEKVFLLHLDLFDYLQLLHRPGTKEKKEQNLFSEDIENIRDVVEEDVPDEYLLELDVKKLRVVLATIIETDDKTVLLMKYQDDMSIKEIADTFDKTESAIKMKIKRAKYKAKELCSQLFKEDTL